MKQTNCCHNVNALIDTQSPFSKIIAFDYYDGVTTGVVLCRICSTSYYFEMLAVDIDGNYDRKAWDLGNEIRIFSLALLPSNSFEQLVNTLSQIEVPKWPVWFPNRKFPDKKLLQKVDEGINGILTLAEQPSLVVATNNLLKKISKAREVGSGQIPKIQDWFLFLELTKEVS